MDPQACLERFLNALEDNDLREAAEAKRDLRAWLANGGFEPNWSEHRPTFDAFQLLPRYTSVGCYPILYMRKGEGFCHCCATAEGLTVNDGDILWEGDGYECDECGELIESAYGSAEVSDERNDDDLANSVE